MKTGVLWSALPVDGAQRAALEAKFSKLYDETVALEVREDNSLLGGVSVEIEGRLYDGSLRGQLTQVLRLLTEGEEGGAHA